MKASYDSSGQADLWRLTTQSRSYFSTNKVCYLDMSLDGALVWLSAGHQKCAFCSLLVSILVQAKITIALLGLDHLVATK